MRKALLAVVLVSAGLAGCIQGGEDLEPTAGPTGAPTSPETSTEETPTRDEADGSPPGNGSGPATENATPTADDGSGAPGGDEPIDPLPSNVTLANATLVERTADSATFRWNGTAPQEPDTARRFVARELALAPDRWLAVNATLTWDKRPGAQLGLDVQGEEHARCSAAVRFRDIGSPDGVRFCESRPKPLDRWRTWDVHVASQPLGPETSGTATREPVNFTLTLRVENVGPDGPWGDLDRAPGRPGAWTPAEEASIHPGVVTWTNSQCTLNVLFTSPDGSSVYAGSAAHCMRGKAIGSMVHIGGIPNAGRLVYCAWGTETHGPGQVACPSWPASANRTHQNDFSLIEIKPSLIDEVNPALPYWGGPTGMADPVEQGERLMLYGNSSFRDGDRDEVPDALDPIRAVALEQTNRTVAMEAPRVIFGDSGGPALDSEGRALGVASGGVFGLEDTKQAPYEVWYANLPWAVSFMEEHTSLEVEVLTAPLEERPWTMGPGGR